MVYNIFSRYLSKQKNLVILTTYSIQIVFKYLRKFLRKFCVTHAQP